MQSNTAWPQQPMGKTDTGFPNKLRNDRMVSWLWLWDRDSTHRLNLLRQRMHQLSQKSTQVILEFNTLVFTPSFRMAPGLLQGSDWFTLRQSRVKWWKNPQHGSYQPFYLHAPGLTLVTHATACIPSTCVPSIWMFLVLPKIT
jgi:hypothetical protein